MEKRRRNKRRWSNRSNRDNKLGMVSIGAVLIMVLIVVAVNCLRLHDKNLEYSHKEKVLQEQIAEEQKRTEEIQELEKYVKTKKYIEEVAKEKLGLVYEDEIIFKAAD
ncbi:FtsB family cell division protein [Anaerobium acetethylicum]|uniref:Septum formation initiator n=1 Tax=Anaerobium acetethylicum TaxID=1619234 RepID=A0A1D3TYN1_9FIRM|nr:septum formation initiator family protein [Anaerobium acetethylicum]SCP99581.1 Septum formation initiator [Anaerobium acetethylicum]